MTFKIIVTTSLVSLLAVGAVSAEDKRVGKFGKGQKSNPIEMMDTDKSGSISLEEFASFGPGKIVGADANSDGELTVAEITSFMEAERKKRQEEALLRRFDADGDGKVTVAEIQSMQEKQFALLDGNDDGTLSEDELRKMRRLMGERGFGKHGGKDRQRGFKRP